MFALIRLEIALAFIVINVLAVTSCTTPFSAFDVKWDFVDGTRYSGSSSSVIDLAVSNDTIYAATTRGVYSYNKDGGWELLADNVGLKDASLEPNILALAIDSESERLFAIKNVPEQKLFLPAGAIYQYQNGQWSVFSEMPTISAEFANGKLYIIAYDPEAYYWDTLIIYDLGAGSEERYPLVYSFDLSGTTNQRDLYCMNLAVDSQAKTVFINCSDGLYLLDMVSKQIELLHVYGMQIDPPSSDYEPTPFYDIVNGGEIATLVASSERSMFEVSLIAYDDYQGVNIELFDTPHLGLLFKDVTTDLYVLDSADDMIYRYDGNEWQLVADAQDLDLYDEIELVCYVPDYGRAYAITGGVVVEINNWRFEDSFRTPENLAGLCKSMLDELPEGDRETVYGNIVDYIKSDTVPFELAVTSQGVLLMRSGGSWETTSPDDTRFYATSIAYDDWRKIIYVGSKENGVFGYKIVQ